MYKIERQIFLLFFLFTSVDRHGSFLQLFSSYSKELYMIYQNKIFVFLILMSAAIINAMQDQESCYTAVPANQEKGILIKAFGSQAMVDKALLGFQLFTTAAVFGGVNYLKDSPIINSVGGCANLNHKDMNTITLVSGGLLAYGLLGSEKLAKAARSLAWRVPVYGLLIAGIYSRSFEQITGMVPFVGPALAQDNKVAKGLLLIGGGILIQPALDYIGAQAEQYFLPEAEDDETEY
jgi:hypothetical protein